MADTTQKHRIRSGAIAAGCAAAMFGVATQFEAVLNTVLLGVGTLTIGVAVLLLMSVYLTPG